MSLARARRLEVSPSAVGSVALHVGVTILLMVQWGSRDLKVGGVVPVTIVSSAPDRDTRPAEQADEVRTAQSEQTVAEAPPEVAPPPPPAPSSKTRPAEKSLDFDSLYASLGRPARNPPRPSSAPTGASRPETALTARQTTGQGLAAGAAVEGLQEELSRRWNPNCNVEGGRDVAVKVTFTLGAAGQVVGRVIYKVQSADTPLAQAAADRAVRAIYAAAPFRGLPPEFYNNSINVDFIAKEACSR